MLSRLRRSVGRPLALVMLAGVVCGLAGTYHAGAADDPECAVLLTTHDPAAHHFADGSVKPAAGEHCAVCHWIQSLRPLVRGRIQPAADRRAHEAVLPFADSQLSDLLTVQVPARSPPFAS
jgi:hypothetical protein